ncbi:MAG: Galactose-1-phosphate uridylyltransferase [Candidatus Roizmanbacteria bacterium GW2011_GWC2_37_13]|uniref:Galactose-1-phosphate uridylyltransferase n=1 Tax=Candidatus Roizmanbacteria bacterium GW2011_GWC2_37_13 TaxID=1618486 RepID=A0A0G0JCU9_9BACT|nr:MAG: Galactose-1-phosphate uridylyltransferase [Candidatus Roizmanbacteria bacterium GW2011_GWC1_37_12]KKQ26001.1 MAG: Galactose-1-phosphate uridylyltransferase [Candidatus Roizmanbacteria bacterium GW2011_GWC2_37_13]
MPNYISDVTKNRWMVSNPKRLVRTGMDGKPFRCPFCEGNEGDTPPEVYRIGGGEVDKPGWQVRVVPNLYPITDIHEVIIHSPDHEKNIEDFSLEQLENIIKTYIDRFNVLKEKGKVFIFHNYSLSSGASLIHPHSQISVVPNDIPTNTLAVQPIVNIVEQKGEFVSYCPEYSEWSYEMWIAENPKSEIRNPKQILNFKFENLNETQIKNLAGILQSSIQKLKKIHNENPHYSKKPFGYNYYIFQPRHPTGVQAQDWYLRIIPRFMERAGFELSTGIMVNSVDPEKAAEELKNIK